MFRLSFFFVLLVGLFCITHDGIAQDKPKEKKQIGKPREAEDLSPELRAIVDELKAKDIKIRIKACDDLKAKGEDAAPATKYICNSLTDPSLKVATAALNALEVVSPQLYKPVSILVLDSHYQNQIDAGVALGLMGNKAKPAMGLMVALLRKAISTESSAGSKREGYSPGLLNLTGSRAVPGARYCANKIIEAILQIDPNESESIRIVKSFASPTNASSHGRVDAFLYLCTLAGDDEAKRKGLFPFMKAGLYDTPNAVVYIQKAGEFGALAKEFLPGLTKMKIAPDKAIRDAAIKAISQIEE